MEIVLGIIVTVLGGVLLYFVQGSIDKGLKRRKRESENLKKLKTINISSPIEFVKAQFGPPQKSYGQSEITDHVFNLPEFSLKIRSLDGTSISTLAICINDLRCRIPVAPGVVLGESKFSDINKENGSNDLVSPGASNYHFIVDDCYFGAPGKYLSYLFGFVAEHNTMQIDHDQMHREGILRPHIFIDFVSMTADGEQLFFYFSDFS